MNVNEAIMETPRHDLGAEDIEERFTSLLTVKQLMNQIFYRLDDNPQAVIDLALFCSGLTDKGKETLHL